MKKIILLFCVCISGIASAQIITIPDANFKYILVNTTCVDSDGNNYPDRDADINNDGEVDQSEALTVYGLTIGNRNIANLTGISYFSNLTTLECYQNQLTTLDISGLTILSKLNCSSNQLTALDLSGLTSLDTLICSGNQLINLDVSGQTNLSLLHCFSNALTTLNIQGLNGIRSLDCHSNALTTLDVSGLTDLYTLDCYSNSLTTLNVSGLVNLYRIDCYSNSLTTLDASGLTSLYRLNCNFNTLTTLNVSGLTSLNTLSCSSNALTILDVSGLASLNFLECSHNQLTTLDVSGLSSLGTLGCGYNALTTINVSGLSSLNTLSCLSNALTTLDVSGLSNLNTLHCSSNYLTNLDVSAQTLLSSLTCSRNYLTTLDLSAQTHLSSLDCSRNYLTTLNIPASLWLSTIDCSYNTLTTLDVSSAIHLTWLYCPYNQLTYLFVKNGANETINFANNPSLTFICCDYFQTQNIQNTVSSYGLTNCNVSSFCNFIPGYSYNTVQGYATFDANNDGCDALDSSYYQFTINITDSVNTGTIIADNNGYFAIPVQAGNYTFTPIIPNSNYFTITPSAIQVTLPDTSNNTLAPFCITPNGIHHDLEVTILPTTPARPGFNASYTLVYKNNGNQTESGSVSFSFDDNVLDFSTASTAPNTTSIGVLTWNFSNLLPFQSESINLVFNCNTPTETPPLNVSDTLYITSTITGGQVDETPLNDTFNLAQVVVGSYDPNDKTCLEGDIITPEMVGDYVHYMIRFENTGTYAAENVTISDIIDISRFDISSLQITASSHSMKTLITNGNEVEFIFEHINLPFDDANNDGYVAFKIKTLATLQLNDTLKNQANIYFDFNAPITTNEAQTVIQLPNDTVPLGLNNINTTLNLFPNPAESMLYILADVQITQADIFDMKGALVRSVSVRNNQIEVQGLSSGTYFTRLYSDAKLYSAKFMVK